MGETGAAAAFLPQRLSLAALREAARGCTACPLWRSATQTVFGEGSADAEVMFVGEQPGDQEDLAGRPFVGPAGRLLHEALEEAGLDRSDLYLTNAVKHFKWEPLWTVLSTDARVERRRGRKSVAPVEVA